jgi:predicted ABC-type transport system involved in lysophospholipase L1 biosynthesis ATPase subunit
MIFLRLIFTNPLRHRASSLISAAGIAFSVAALLTVVTILEGAVGPKILLADEPTGSLDEKTTSMIFDLLLEVVAAAGITLLMATHDRSLAKRCHRLVEMHEGKIREHAYAR